jgi:uncharacterized protein (DUF934 family)
MGLIRNGELVADPYTLATGLDPIPADCPVIVSLEQWQAAGGELGRRGQPLGIRLRSDQHPRLIAADLGHFALIALEFPRFRDGRAYTYARYLRERASFRGEVRAVGDVLQEQLGFMQRCGFDAFEVSAVDPVKAWAAVASDHSVWYQATGDARPRALDLRHRR